VFLGSGEMRGQWIFCGMVLLASGAQAADGEFRFRALAGGSSYASDFSFSNLRTSDGDPITFETTGLDDTNFRASWGVSAGYDFGGFALDVGFNSMVGEAQTGSYTFVGSGGTEFDSQGDEFSDNEFSGLYGITLSLGFNLTERFEFFARGGYAYTDASLTTNQDGNNQDKLDLNFDGITYGLGGTYYLTEQFFVTGSYDIFDFDSVSVKSLQSEADVLDVSAEFGVLGVHAGIEF